VWKSIRKDLEKAGRKEAERKKATQYTPSLVHLASARTQCVTS
jgi:hypothetical protein